MIRKNMVFLWVTALLPLLLCLWFYPQLPELIPTNFNNGEITKYGPKATIWIIGGLGPVIALLFTLLPMVDPAAGTMTGWAAGTICWQAA